MNELTTIIQQSGVEETKAQMVLGNFKKFFDEAGELENKVKGLNITSVEQTEEMQLARDVRLELRQVRISAEKTKKRLKENILIEGRLIDGIYNSIVAVTKPLENDLLEKEKYIERIEQAKRGQIKFQRINQLEKFEVDCTLYDLLSMPESKYIELLANSETLYNAKKDAERKIEEDKLKQLEKDKLKVSRMFKTSRLIDFIDNYDGIVWEDLEESEYKSIVSEAVGKREAYEKEQLRIQEENEKLKKDAEKRESEILAQKKLEEEKLKKESDARERIERERVEKDLSEKKALQEKLDKEKLEREKIEREINQKALDQERLEKEAEEKERLEKLALDQAPDKEKLLALAEEIKNIKIPELKTKQFIELAQQIESKLFEINTFIKGNVNK